MLRDCHVEDSSQWQNWYKRNCRGWSCGGPPKTNQ